jgi:RNA polymerase sigma factor (sigma-70 family)
MNAMAEKQSAEAIRFQEIAAKLARGEESALEEVLYELGPGLAARLRGHFANVLSLEDIDDVLAQMLYRIWEHRHTYQADRAPFPVWCYVIGRNIALDMIRAKSKEKEVLSALWSELRARARPHEGSSSGSAVAALQQILAEMHPVDRSILFESVGGHEAWAAKLAPELGLSPGNVRQRRFRALAKLREEMARRGFPV